MSRDGEEYFAPGPRETNQRRERCDVVVNVFQHVKGSNEVEGFGCERDVIRESAASDVRPRVTIAGGVTGVLKWLKRAHLSALIEQPEIAAGAASRFENPRLFRQGNPVEQGGDHRAATYEPPVAVLMCGHQRVGGWLHPVLQSVRIRDVG
jgi:hypothetical protein